MKDIFTIVHHVVLCFYVTHQYKYSVSFLLTTKQSFRYLNEVSTVTMNLLESLSPQNTRSIQTNKCHETIQYLLPSYKVY